MKKLSREKRNNLVLVIVITLVILAGIWFGLVSHQEENLTNLAESKRAAQRKLAEMKKAIDSAEKVDASLADARGKLAKLEDEMAPSGDLLSWTINTLRDFKVPYKVEIPQFSQIDGPKDATILANFPYQQATLTVAGTALFHDLGRFIADFENHFPFSRLQNLTIEPAASTAANEKEKEKLSFRMDIVVLVKPGAT